MGSSQSRVDKNGDVSTPLRPSQILDEIVKDQGNLNKPAVLVKIMQHTVVGLEEFIDKIRDLLQHVTLDEKTRSLIDRFTLCSQDAMALVRKLRKMQVGYKQFVKVMNLFLCEVEHLVAVRGEDAASKLEREKQFVDRAYPPADCLSDEFQRVLNNFNELASECDAHRQTLLGKANQAHAISVTCWVVAAVGLAFIATTVVAIMCPPVGAAIAAAIPFMAAAEATGAIGVAGSAIAAGAAVTVAGTSLGAAAVATVGAATLKWVHDEIQKNAAHLQACHTEGRKIAWFVNGLHNEADQVFNQAADVLKDVANIDTAKLRETRGELSKSLQLAVDHLRTSIQDFSVALDELGKSVDKMEKNLNESVEHILNRLQ